MIENQAHDDCRVAVSMNDGSRADWRERVPKILREVTEGWGLTLGEPFAFEECGNSWVAPVKRRDEGEAVLKIGFPHMEAESEIAGFALLEWRSYGGAFGSGRATECAVAGTV